MSTSVTVNKSALTAPGPGRDTTWGANNTNLLVALASASGLDRLKTFYVHKNGLDSYDGLSPNKALLTIGAAITLANAESPISGGEVGIMVCDGGTYTETFVLAGFVKFIAPAARIIGSIDVATSTHIKVHEISGSANGVTKTDSDAGTATIDVDIINAGTTGIAITDGIISGNVGTLIGGTNNYNVGSGTTLNLFAWTSSGTPTGSGTANVVATTTLVSGVIKADGTVAMTGNLDMGSQDIINCANITLNGIKFSANSSVGLFEV